MYENNASIVMIHWQTNYICTTNSFRFVSSMHRVTGTICIMPYSWLYKSRIYIVLSIAIPIAALVVDLIGDPWVLAAMLLCVEVLFSACLTVEVKKL